MYSSGHVNEQKWMEIHHLEYSYRTFEAEYRAKNIELLGKVMVNAQLHN